MLYYRNGSGTGLSLKVGVERLLEASRVRGVFRCSSRRTQLHPYQEYEDTKLWAELESSILALVDNSDIKLTTSPEYVIGFLCSRLDKCGVLGDSARCHTPRQKKVESRLRKTASQD